MKTHTKNIADFFHHIEQGTKVPLRLRSYIKSSAWKECVRQSLNTSNTKALEYLQKSADEGAFFQILVESLKTCHYDSGAYFLQVLACCPHKNLTSHDDIRAFLVGENLILSNNTPLFEALFNHIENNDERTKKWGQYSVLRNSEVSKFLVPHLKSSDCVFLLRESILTTLSAQDLLLNHMNTEDIGWACGAIAHVKDKRAEIVNALDKRPDSWHAFATYDNELANLWIAKAFAEHQNKILHQSIASAQHTKIRSKI